MLAGLAKATVTSVVYITQYETDCNVCPSSSKAAVVVPTAVVAAIVSTTQQASVVVAAGPVVVSSANAGTNTVAVALPQTSTKPATAVVAAVAVTLSSATPASSSTVPSISACPATAHTDALGSKNYPRVITPVSSTSPNLVYGPQYFASIGNGNSTIFTFDYQKAGTCTLEFKFPTVAQIKALQGTTDYKLSGTAIAITLYQLLAVASPNTNYAQKPARGAAFTTTLTPGSNSTITSFACPVGTSVSYEMVATDTNTLSWFEDYNRKAFPIQHLMEKKTDIHSSPTWTSRPHVLKPSPIQDCNATGWQTFIEGTCIETASSWVLDMLCTYWTDRRQLLFCRQDMRLHSRLVFILYLDQPFLLVWLSL